MCLREVLMHVRPGFCGSVNDLLRAVDRGGRIGLDELAGVGVGGCAGLRGESRHSEVFVGAGAWGVADENADAERAVGELRAQSGEDPLDVPRARLLLPCRVSDVCEGGADASVGLDTGEYLHPGHRPGGREPEIQRSPLGRRGSIGDADRVHPGFELEGGGDAVESLQSVAGHRLRMTVQVDEPRADDQAGDVNDLGSLLLSGKADGRDAVTADDDVGHLVASQLGIDDPPSTEHDHSWHADDPISRMAIWHGNR